MNLKKVAQYLNLKWNIELFIFVLTIVLLHNQLKFITLLLL